MLPSERPVALGRTQCADRLAPDAPRRTAPQRMHHITPPAPRGVMAWCAIGMAKESTNAGATLSVTAVRFRGVIS